MPRQRLADMPPAQRKLIVVGATVQLVLLAAALADIHFRSSEQIRGPKRLWVAVSFVNIAGPVAYFTIGRKRQARPAD